MQIHINNPCKENLANIQINSEGFFCPQCAKNVIDFSKKSDKEIVDYIANSQEDNICGYFRKNQLRRELHTSLSLQEKILKDYFQFSKKPKKNIFQLIYIAILYLFISFFSPISELKAQDKTELEKKDKNPYQIENNSIAEFGGISTVSYEGGINALRKTIQEKLDERLKTDKKYQNSVIVSFVIDEEGKITKVQFQPSSKTPHLNKEVNNIIEYILLNETKRFSPAKDARGNKVKSKKTLPISY
ncbi:MAG: energy transducer TonB [Thermonemataceae bacterium]|nr:energy transducer TonB [Thermonemataceae bacterium]